MLSFLMLMFGGEWRFFGALSHANIPTSILGVTCIRTMGPKDYSSSRCYGHEPNDRWIQCCELTLVVAFSGCVLILLKVPVYFWQAVPGAGAVRCLLVPDTHLVSVSTTYLDIMLDTN